MGDQAAGAAWQGFGEGAGGDAAGGTGQHGIGARQAIELGEQGLLGVDALGAVFLDVLGSADGVGQGGGGVHAGGDEGGRFAQEVGFGELGQAFGDEALSGVDLLRERVPERDIEAGAGEYDGPGTADQSRSNDSDLGHGTFSALGLEFSEMVSQSQLM